MNLVARECPLSFNLVGVYQTLRAICPQWPLA